MPTQTQSIELAGKSIDTYRHVCAFFHDRQEWCAVLLPYIKEGLDRGDKAFHIVDPRGREEHLRQMDEAGIDTNSLENEGRLEVRTWYQAYLREGHFDQNAMLALIQEVLNEGHSQGYPLTRLVADMEWALEDRPGVTDIVEYETRLNYILPNFPDPVV